MDSIRWEVFAETVPEDVATAVFGAVEDPKPLARELARCAPTLIHNDLRGANLGFPYLDRGLLFMRIELCQDLVGRHMVSNIRQPFRDPTADAESEVRLNLRAYLAR